MHPSASWFQRILLPGFAFKAVVIGGGYATGRELVEFFLPSGPAGGLLGILVTTILWSLVCAATFLFARVTMSFTYRDFFSALLGRFWPLFEICYFLLMLLVLSVFGAAAGEIFRAVFGLPPLTGMLALAIGIVGFATFGNASVEALFKYVSIFLYATYALFIVLMVAGFGDRIAANLTASPPPTGWLAGGITYAGYNLVGAVVILPIARHFTSNRDAVAAGLLCGPLAALPAFLFFIALIAFYPEIADAPLPSDFMLQRLGFPLFHLVFQTMVLAALLESGTGMVHAMNERIAKNDPAFRTRLMVGTALVALAMFVAAKVGLVALIAEGYGVSAYIFLGIFVVPLFAIGVPRILRAMKDQHRPYRP